MAPSEPDPWSHRLQYGAFRGLRWILSALPAPIALGCGDVLGWIVAVVFRLRRGVVDDNLLQAFPDAEPGWRNRVARASYRHLIRESIATFRMASVDREELLEWVRTDLDTLRSFLRDMDRGEGVIVVTGHLGNWELGGAWLAAGGVPMEAVIQVQRNRRFDDDLRRVRERVGLRTIPKQDAPRGVLRALRAGHAAALVADQNVTRGGLFVDFFGRPAATARGPAVFAVRAGVPVWAGVAFRVSRHPQRYELRLRRFETPATGDTEADVRSLTESCARQLESWIREAPEQYFWHHKRWKTRPPTGERPPSGDDITLTLQEPDSSRRPS